MFLKFIFLVLFLNKINSASFKLKPLEPSEGYTHFATIDEDDPNLYQVFWKLVNDEIMFELHCRTTGYVGIGLSTNGGMPGADIAISWVNNNGAAFVKDTHATDFTTPKLDKHQDWFLIDAAEINGYTIVKLKRKLNTCDKEEDFEIKDETHYLLFAWNDRDPVTGNNDWVYHGTSNRRIRVDILLNFRNETLAEESDDVLNAIIFDYFLPNITIKKQKTFYYCQFIPWPQYDSDVHLIRYDILGERKNRDILHHLVVYDCPTFIEVDSLEGSVCGDEIAPDNMNWCLKSPVIISWGVGGQKNYTFPKDTGLPHYKTNKTRYLLAEYHYDNPTLDETRKDSTGLRLYFTEKLRKHELGVLTLGTNGLLTDITIPPRMDSLTMSLTCYPDCTQKFLPDEGITLLSGFMHTHMAGRGMRTKLVRNNQVVKYLFDNPKYDFNYQFNIEIQPFKLLKGDKLITECVYSTVDRDNITFFGFSTDQEMCFNFIYYYPRMNSFDKCFSRQALSKMFEFYEKLASDGLIPPVNLTLEYESFLELASILRNQVNYTDELRSRFKENFENPKIEEIICGSTFDIENAIVQVEKQFEKPIEMVIPDDQCRSNSSPLKKSLQTTNFFSIMFILILFLFNI